VGKTLTIAAICLVASVVLADTQKVQPLKVKTGLWEMTETIKWTGLPPQMAAMAAPRTRAYKSCVTAKDLNTNPWADGSGYKCNWTVLNSTGSDMEVQATSCDLGENFYGMKADIHGKIHVQNSENGTGSMAVTVSGNGQTMNGNASYTGKWIAATCPAEIRNEQK
jgi:Protein of unknown function (DUF3617)